MSAPIKVRVVLIGHYAGQTVKLNKFEFFQGKLDLVGPPTDVAMDLQFLERSYQAYPEGHPALVGLSTAAAQINQENGDGLGDLQTNQESDPAATLSGNSESDGTGSEAGGAAPNGGESTGSEAGQTGGVSNGDGQPAELNQRLLKAVHSLDPENDAHWTAAGQPAIQALQGLYGSTGFTRADVEGVAPGFNREAARGPKE